MKSLLLGKQVLQCFPIFLPPDECKCACFSDNKLSFIMGLWCLMIGIRVDGKG